MMNGVALKVVADEGNDVLMWSITGSVPGREWSEKVNDFVLSNLQPGAIIDYHDGIGRGTFDRTTPGSQALIQRRTAGDRWASRPVGARHGPGVLVHECQRGLDPRDRRRRPVDDLGCLAERRCRRAVRRGTTGCGAAGGRVAGVYAHPMAEYRVEAVHWDGDQRGAAHLETLLNEWAAEAWTVVSIVPTRAATSMRALVSASASADTTELAIVLTRD